MARPSVTSKSPLPQGVGSAPSRLLSRHSDLTVDCPDGSRTATDIVPQESWRPILDGALAERALEATHAIAASLRGEFLEKVEHAALAGGYAGLAVLYAYLDEAELGEGYDETTVMFLRRAIDGLSDSVIGPSLYGGFTGIAWAVEHLKGGPLDPDDDDANRQVDEALKDYLGRSPWTDDYDLVSGLVGFGVYALESLPRPLALECIERIVDRLEETAEQSAEGTTWHTAPHLLAEWQRQRHPNGYYNLGVAHGVPGVIAFLGHVSALPVRNPHAPISTQTVSKARSLLSGAVRWLAARELPGTDGPRFPSCISPGLKEGGARLAWCYGDAGIAAALLAAARGAGEPLWERMALDIARQAVERAPETAGVLDAGLCHGTAGLGHIFNRIYQATEQTLFKEAATFWFERSIEMRRAVGGVGGFFARGLVDGETRWLADPGLVNGAGGIALALLSAIAAVEPAWDRILLLSTPSRRGAGSS